jgi:hypothetical protein
MLADAQISRLPAPLVRHWCAVGALVIPVRHCLDQGHDHSADAGACGATDLMMTSNKEPAYSWLK